MATAHLLLVDDSPEVTGLVRLMARRLGVRLSAEAFVEAAWDALRQGPPDLVLLDVNLLGESGLTLLRRVRAVGGGDGADSDPAPVDPALPIALFCQPELSDDIAAGWSLGADFLVSKALLAEPERWQRRIAEILRRVRGQDDAPLLGRGTGADQPAAHAPGIAALAQLLEGPHLRLLGPALLHRVLHRSLTRALGPGVPLEAVWPPDRCLGYLSGLRLASPQIRRLCAVLVDQLWCLFGAEVSAPVELALTSLPGPTPH